MANTIKLGNGTWATKEGSLLAYNDENNNFKPLPFTTTRASSATVVNKQGLIETVGSGIPRIDFKDDTKGALKLEPQRSNLLVQSNNFNTSWTKTLSTVTSEEIAAPISGEMADSIIATATSGGHRVIQTPSTTGVGTFTMYIKQKELSRICVHFLGAGKAAGFDCSDNTTFAATGIASYPTRYNISDFGNGWSKVEMYDVGITTRVDIYIANPTSGGNNAVWTGDGTSKIYFSAAQLEQGSYATSYIPTQGGVVTRNQDTASGSGNSTVINSTEGVLYANLSNIKSQNFDSIVINNGIVDENNTVRIWFYNNTITYQYKVGSATSAQIASGTIDLTSDTKVACSWKLNEFKLFVNGLQRGVTDTSGSVLANGTLKSVQFKRGNNTGNFYGKTKDLRVYTTVLSDAELAILTTI